MTVPIDATLEAVVRRDRLVVVTALTTVIALSWAYLLSGAGMGMSAFEMTRVSQLGIARSMSEEGMAGMAGMAMMTRAVWTPGYAVLMFLMWWVMMVAMMLPGAAPVILLFATINRRQREAGHPYVATGIFAFGYLAAWAGFSLVAVVLQWGFERTGILSSMLVATNAIFGGLLLLAAGVYQLTPIKHSCLRHCRAPLSFLSTHWVRGARGALRMGLLQGAFCVGCCWLLMGLMFCGGVMNFYWISSLALFVLFEKTVPAGHWLAYATGVVLLIWGAGMLALNF
ncbi:DUF2182 domain-containing protein [Cupriavidus necator]|uniref:DUF2182 domain-containing protein n=1 Tax=Cupriavidus necator TaxID=106590 RepID=UPI0039C06754